MTRKALERAAYSPREVAELTGLSLWTVRRLLRRGDLHAVRVGRRILIPRAALERMLA